jgi:hypothetical protein
MLDYQFVVKITPLSPSQTAIANHLVPTFASDLLNYKSKFNPITRSTRYTNISAFPKSTSEVDLRLKYENPKEEVPEEEQINLDQEF